MKWARVCSHELWVPDSIAEWDAVAEDSRWEQARMQSILTILTPGDVFYEVGAEHGWMAAIYAQHVGPGNTVLIEPSPMLWPNIRKTWEANFGDTRPRGVWPGFVSNCVINAEEDWLDEWPDSSVGDEVAGLQYLSLADHGEFTPTVTIDWLVSQLEAPKGLSIDVEGAELLVLEGMTETLTDDKPWVWLSMHPDLMLDNYGHRTSEIRNLFGAHGYSMHLLAVDHEEHWICWPTAWGRDAWRR
jgi:FkbM family methyltransferase